jgi:hypothetical protein
VKKSELKGQRTTIEQAFIEKVHAAISPDVDITLLADRGFGDQVLYEVLELLGWNFVIRFRGSILVEHDGIQQPASQCLPTMRDDWFDQLMDAFVEVLEENQAMLTLLGEI